MVCADLEASPESRIRQLHPGAAPRFGRIVGRDKTRLTSCYGMPTLEASAWLCPDIASCRVVSVPDRLRGGARHGLNNMSRWCLQC
jgi:hypothetical protein